MPVDRDIPMCDIDEPSIPMREEMDDAELDALCVSLRERGLLQRIGLKAKGGRWEIKWGHRRFVGCKRIGLDPIPSRCYAVDESGDEEDMFAENFCREAVNDGAVAVWLGQLVTDKGYTEADLMRITRKSADWIGDRFRLLRGDAEVLDALRAGKIKMAVARELNKVPDEYYRRYFLAQAIDTQASQRQVSVWIQHIPVHSEPAGGVDTPPAEAVAATGVAATAVPCAWCKESEMQHHITYIPVHHWCREQMEQALKQAGTTA